MIEIEIKLYGPFRKYEDKLSPFFLHLPEAASVDQIKAALTHKLKIKSPDFSDSLLVLDSAIADDRRILLPNDLVSKSCVLSILPPVCGG